MNSYQFFFPLICCFMASTYLKGIQGADVSNRVESLPGQPPVKFKQYAGYITVSESHKRAFFYWFVEADHEKAASQPLAFWFNGGPGCSSVGVGALEELGPFFPNYNGTGLVRNKHSWNKCMFSLLLINLKVRECTNSSIKHKTLDVEYSLRSLNIKSCVGSNSTMLLLEIVNLLKSVQPLLSRCSNNDTFIPALCIHHVRKS